MPPVPLTAVLALLIFPFFVWWLFEKYDATRASFLAILVGHMFLPDGDATFDFPLLPPIGKAIYPSLLVLAVLLVKHGPLVKQSRFFRGPETISLIAMLGLFGTYITNPEPLHYGRFEGIYQYAKNVTLPGLTFKDFFSMFLRDFLYFIAPFLVGRAVFRTRNDLRTFLQLMAVFGICYVPLMLIELRVSPQVHTWVYGYYPHPAFSQAMRWGGWRPQVFFIHGLNLARHMLMVFLAITALRVAKFEKIWRFDARTVALASPVLVILCKSTGAIVLMMLFGLIHYYLSIKNQVRLLLIFAIMVTLYLYSQASGTLDVKEIIKAIEPHAPERAASLAYRFRNEIELCERVAPKAWFGWGGFGRAHIWDPDFGRDLTTIDGYWIGRYAYFGAFGLFAPYFLHLIPVYLLFRRYKKIPWEPDQRMAIIVVSMSLLYGIDNLPNAISSNFAFVVAGAAWGFVSTLSDPAYIRKESRKHPRAGRGHIPPILPGQPYPGAPAAYPAYAPPPAGPNRVS